MKTSLPPLLLVLALTGCPTDEGCEPCDDPTLEPEVHILAPDNLTVYPPDVKAISFDYEVTGLEPGQGSVEFTLDGDPYYLTELDELQGSVTFETINDWSPGWHRISGLVTRPDFAPYTNPGASVQTVIYLGDSEPARPQFVFIAPLDHAEHGDGEPLEVHMGILGFDFADAPEDCKAPEDCDPFDPNAECGSVNCDGTPVSRSGHVHLLVHCESYAACGPDYELEVEPSSASLASSHEMMVTIPGEVLRQVVPDTPIRYTVTATLHYGDHASYPNEEFVISDEIEIEVQ